MEYTTRDESECYNAIFLEKYLNRYGLNNFQIKHSFDKNNKNCRLNIIFADTTLDPKYDDILKIHMASLEVAEKYADYSSHSLIYRYKAEVESQSEIKVENDTQCKLYGDLVNEHLKDISTNYSRLFHKFHDKSSMCFLFVKK